MSSQTVTLTDTVGVTDTRVARLVFARSLTDSVGISDHLATRYKFSLANAVGLTDVVIRHSRAAFADAVGTTSVATSSGSLVQYDTWRPTTSPTNHLVLACRTPEGDHDDDLSAISLWTFKNDGTNENVVLRPPSVYNWNTYGHPEWSPDGQSVVIYAEDNTTYKIVVLDTTGYDRPLT